MLSKLLEKYTIPAGYEDILQKRVLIITGVGRSGTTILGKVIGSLKPTYYLFEPALMKLIPFLIKYDESKIKVYSLLIRSILFEDYFLQAVHGRSLNFNVQDDSYVGNYMSKSDIRKRWRDLVRRQDALRYLENEQPLFVIKTPEFQPLCPVAQETFVEPKFIHIIRSGNDIVSSTLNRGWYTDEYMNTAIVDWVEKPDDAQSCNIPWYIDSQSKENFPYWNQITRAACIWRSLVESGMAFCAKNPQTCIEIKYEDFVRSPVEYTRQFEQAFGLESTEITRRQLNSIKSHKPGEHPSYHEGIEEPERAKFMSLMKRLGYMER